MEAAGASSTGNNVREGEFDTLHEQTLAARQRLAGEQAAGAPHPNDLEDSLSVDLEASIRDDLEERRRRLITAREEADAQARNLAGVRGPVLPDQSTGIQDELRLRNEVLQQRRLPPPPVPANAGNDRLSDQIESTVRALVHDMLRGQAPGLQQSPFSLTLSKTEENAKVSREILAKVLENELINTSFNQPSTKNELVALHRKAVELGERLGEISRIPWGLRSGSSPAELVLGSLETLFIYELEKTEMMKLLAKRHDVPNMSMATKRDLTDRALELWTRTRDSARSNSSCGVPL